MAIATASFGGVGNNYQTAIRKRPKQFAMHQSGRTSRVTSSAIRERNGTRQRDIWPVPMMTYSPVYIMQSAQIWSATGHRLRATGIARFLRVHTRAQLVTGLGPVVWARGVVTLWNCICRSDSCIMNRICIQLTIDMWECYSIHKTCCNCTDFANTVLICLPTIDG